MKTLSTILISAILVFLGSVPVHAQCAAIVAGYFACDPILGPSMEDGEDLKIGYDINAASGNLFLAQPDIHVYPGDGPPLHFIRYYNSQANGLDIGIGSNWSHTYSWYLTVSGLCNSSVAIVADTGRVIAFSLSNASTGCPANGGLYTPMAGEFGNLTTTGNGWLYTTKFGVSYTFDSQGRLTSIAPADDSAISVNYASTTGRQISSVSSGSLSLTFTYSGSEISSITDPAGAVWYYSYGGQPPWTEFAPSVTELFRNQTKAPPGGQLLSDVTEPEDVKQCSLFFSPQVYGDTFYSYSDSQWFQESPGTTFYGRMGAAELTAYARTTSIPIDPCLRFPFHLTDINISLLGIFSYTAPPNSIQATLLYGSNLVGHPPDVVSEAARNIVNGSILGIVLLQFSAGNPYPQNPSEGFIVADLLIGGLVPGVAFWSNRQAVSKFPAELSPRLASLNSTAGVGIAGEMQSESWQWNPNLTLASHTDGVGIVNSFTSYDALGNPTTIVEASNAAGQNVPGVGIVSPRTTTICYHPTLSRPLVVSRQSVDGISSHSHTIAWDYTSNYGAPSQPYCNQPNITPFVHQIIESGYTDETLSGQLGALEFHTLQVGYEDLNGNIYGPYPPNTHLQMTTIVGPRPGAQTTIFYYPSGHPSAEWQLVSNSNSPLATILNSYDPDGRLTAYIDASGNTHSVGYDSQGRVTQIETISAASILLSAVDNITYDLAGNELSHQIQGGSTLSTTYDTAMRPTYRQAQSAQGKVAWTRVVDYDGNGKPTTLRLFSGQGIDEGPGCSSSGSEQFCVGATYDLFERLQQQVNLNPDNSSCGEGCGEWLGYDQNGQIQWRTILQDTASVYSYTRDQFNRVAGIGTEVPYSYASTLLTHDVNDQITSRTDPLGNVTTYLYDDFSHLIKLVSPDAGTWISNYDAAGNVTSSRDPLGTIATYSYDNLNRRTQFVTTSSSPISSSDNITYVYDETGEIPGSNGQQYSNTAGRLTSVLAVGVSWDIGSNVITPSINTHFTYDFRGWRVAEIDERGADPNLPGAFSAGPTSYTWGPNHELLNMTYPDGEIVTYTYDGAALDAAGTPLASGVQMFFGANPLSLDATYFADGQPQWLEYGNNSQTQVTRNMRGEITQVVSGPPNSPLVSETYSYLPDQIGLVTAVTQNNFPGATGEARQITYNPYGLPLSYSRSTNNSATQSVSWSYDANGNPIAPSYNGTSVNNGGVPLPFYTPGTDQILQTQAIAVGLPELSIDVLAYDPAGDLQFNTFGVPEGVQGFIYRYNARHHLGEMDFDLWATYYPPGWTTSSGPPDIGQPLRIYNYDGLDRLWQRLDNNTSISYLYPSSSSPQSESEGGGTHQYFYDLSDRVAEELESVGGIFSGSYLVTDHIYLGATAREVARIVRTWNDSSPEYPGLYLLQNQVIQYLDQDGRGAIAAVESQDISGATWQATISPFGELLAYGPRGPGAIMQTEEEIATTLPNSLAGLSGASGTPAIDGYLATQSTCGPNGMSGCQIVGEIDPLVGLSYIPSTNVLGPYGWTPYKGPVATGQGGVGSGDAVPDPENGFAPMAAISEQPVPDPENGFNPPGQENQVSQDGSFGLFADVFAFYSHSSSNPGPIRLASEGVAIAGYDRESGAYMGGIVATGVEVGSHENYGAVFVGSELTSASRTPEPILIEEVSYGVEVPWLFGFGVGGGLYEILKERGLFFYLQGGTLGQYGSVGIGFSTSEAGRGSSFQNNFSRSEEAPRRSLNSVPQLYNGPDICGPLDTGVDASVEIDLGDGTDPSQP